ncbi:pyruvate kinase, partial [Paenarthrobacter sp. CM16]|uniref:pyruvate kinase alpha/beta domain-containing protein n=1 Tax=Paenarthrobacter sp. CM16 TaxID=2738447 RepID=UPI00273883DD
PVLVPSVGHTDEMTAQVDKSLLQMDLVDEGDLVVIAAGSPPGQAGSTNSLKVHKVGDLADTSKVDDGSRKEPVGPWPEKKSKTKA